LELLEKALAKERGFVYNKTINVKRKKESGGLHDGKD